MAEWIRQKLFLGGRINLLQEWNCIVSFYLDNNLEDKKITNIIAIIQYKFVDSLLLD